MQGQTNESAPPPSAPRPSPPSPAGPSVTSTVVGILMVGITVLVLGFWVDARRGAGAGAGNPVGPPQIVLVEPEAGAVVGSRVPVLFEVPAQLRPGPGGWQTGRLHIHATVDGRELMPGREDIERVGASRYRWTLPPLQPGAYTLQLFWSDPAHRPIEEGASATVSVEVR